MGPNTTATDVLAPMSDLQRHWWGRERLFPDPGLVMCTLGRVRGAVDVTLLEAAAEAVVRRHEALRTNFGRVDGVPVQIIHESPAQPVTWFRDISGTPESARVAVLRELADAEQNRSLDLASAPLMRLGVVRCAEKDFVLVLTLHHIIADGWAVGVLWRELSHEYAQLLRGGIGCARAPGPRPPQLRDWVAHERRTARGPKAAREISHWGRVLREVRPLHVPHDLPGADRPARRKPCTHGFDLPQHTHDALVASAKGFRATPHMVAMAAFMKLLSRHVDRPDVAVMTLFNRRASPETVDLVGCVLNFAVIAAVVPPGGEAAPLVQNVRSALLDAYENQDICAQNIWQEVGFAPASVDVMFIFDQGTPDSGGASLGGVGVEPYTDVEEDEGERFGGASTPGIKFRLGLTPGRLTGAVGYDSNLYSRSFIETFVTAYGDLLAGITADRGSRGRRS
ncbi:condensation domain-containing protein [Streptomyces sp. NPDC014734]|uniref:condensation domain-containing protein n=1 Tax=Streptomyces sp. NPDC014734 TaxID=3364886 RepID=UPI003701E6DB